MTPDAVNRKGHESASPTAANLHRYTVDTIIGPCEEWEAQDLTEAIASLRQFSNVGGGAVGITQMEDDDE